MSGHDPRSRLRRAGRLLTRAGSAAAVALTAHTVLNLRALREPDDEPAPVRERVSVLLPVRDEAHQVGHCVQALLEQVAVPDLEILVLDDGSIDGTAEVVRAVAGDDPRVRLLAGAELPPLWLGKPHACHQLAAAASGSVLVFVDADVTLAPHAVAATVNLLRETGLDLVSPCPRQLAETPAERLVQPLLQWSFLTTLPLGLAERSPRGSLSAATGQLLAVDTTAYHRAGGHRAVRDQVLEDLQLLRAVKAAGGTGGMVNGSRVASCRMYLDWPSLREGYTKSLWAAFGSPAAAAAVLTGLGLVYVLPAAAALGRSRAGLTGYAAAVVGRYLVAERTGGRSLPDSLGHPASIVVLAGMTVDSWRRHRRGELFWKGRALPGAAGGPASAPGAGAPGRPW